SYNYQMTQKASDKKYIANVFNRSDIFLSISEISINTTYNSTSTYYCTVKQFTSSLCLTISIIIIPVWKPSRRFQKNFYNCPTTTIINSLVFLAYTASQLLYP